MVIEVHTEDAPNLNDSTMAKPRVLALGNYGCSNAGDELLLATMHRWVNEAGANLRAISLNPAYTAKVHGVPAVDYFDLSAIAQEMNKADLFVLGGGGIFQDRYPMAADALYRYPSYSILQFAQVCYMARQFGVPVLLWAQGLGPLETNQALSLVADLFSSVEHLSVRDETALALLRECGVTRSVIMGPDPVWSLPLEMPLIDLTGRFPQIAGRKVLIVNALCFPFERAWEGTFMSAIEKTLPTDWVCLWLPFQYNAYAPHPSGYAMPDDATHFRSMIRLVPDGSRHIIWERPGVFEMPSAFAAADAIVTMRFHGTILARRSGTPFVAVEYDDKVTQAMNQVQLDCRARVPLLASEATYVSSMRWLFEQVAGGHEVSGGVTVESLASRAIVHREVLQQAIWRAGGSPRARKWKSNHFDWLSAWISQLERDRWQAIDEMREARTHAIALQSTIQDHMTRIRDLEESLRLSTQHNTELRNARSPGISRLLRRLFS